MPADNTQETKLCWEKKNKTSRLNFYQQNCKFLLLYLPVVKPSRYSKFVVTDYLFESETSLGLRISLLKYNSNCSVCRAAENCHWSSLQLPFYSFAMQLCDTIKSLSHINLLHPALCRLRFPDAIKSKKRKSHNCYNNGATFFVLCWMDEEAKSI